MGFRKNYPVCCLYRHHLRLNKTHPMPHSLTRFGPTVNHKFPEPKSVVSAPRLSLYIAFIISAMVLCSLDLQSATALPSFISNPMNFEATEQSTFQDASTTSSERLICFLPSEKSFLLSTSFFLLLSSFLHS